MSMFDDDDLWGFNGADLVEDDADLMVDDFDSFDLLDLDEMAEYFGQPPIPTDLNDGEPF